jgi:XTP/dITP diphosphohydrolase
VEAHVSADSTRGKLTIVLATRNAGKAREFGRLLGDAFSVGPLSAEVEMPEETGATFEENARLKAEAIFEALGGTFAVLSDDSGLEVTALGGKPGVYSARYAGEDATDQDNVSLLLAEMWGVEDRSARFVCNLCLILPFADVGDPDCEDYGDRIEVEVSGSADGVIELEPRGTEGFGYDPVFRPFGWSETLGEAATDKKDAISHRGAAARALVERLRVEGWLGSGS